MNPAATQHHEGKELRLEFLHDWNKSHTIPAAPEKMSWVQMMRNMRVLRTVFRLIVRKNYVENVSGVGVQIGTWHERKVHRRKHMGRQMIGGTGSGSDIHHRGTTIAIIR